MGVPTAITRSLSSSAMPLSSSQFFQVRRGGKFPVLDAHKLCQQVHRDGVFALSEPLVDEWFELLSFPVIINALLQPVVNPGAEFLGGHLGPLVAQACFVDLLEQVGGHFHAGPTQTLQPVKREFVGRGRERGLPVVDVHERPALGHHNAAPPAVAAAGYRTALPQPGRTGLGPLVGQFGRVGGNAVPGRPAPLRPILSEEIDSTPYEEGPANQDCANTVETHAILH